MMATALILVLLKRGKRHAAILWKDDKYNELSEWYDGYRFGNTEIFNPWSVINYISDNCFPKAFWQSTGSNEIIGEIIQAATPEITKDLYKLLCGEKSQPILIPVLSIPRFRIIHIVYTAFFW